MEADRRIIVLIDFQVNTDKIVDEAIAVAQKLSARIHFLNFFDFYADDPMLENPYVDRCEKKLLASRQIQMKKLLATLSEAEQNCTGEVVKGNQDEFVSELSTADRSDLVLMSAGM